MRAKSFKKLTAILLSVIMAFGIMTAAPITAGAAEMTREIVQSDATLLPSTKNNTTVSLRSKSSLTEVDNGYMRVYYDGDVTIGIEYYDNDFNITSKKSIAMELEYWGGFYAGENAYYVVEGQRNTEEDDTAEVIRVIKYDANWNRLGVAAISTSTVDGYLFGSEVRYPFDYGCVEMSEHDGTLFVVTGHQGYVDDSVGQGHQGYLMVAVDESAMTGKIVDADCWHSFAQYIETDSDDLYVLEQSEGSRCTKLSKRNADAFANAQYNWAGNYSDDDETTISVLDYGGSRTSAWAIACYASVDDLAVSKDNVLSLGTSIDQSEYDNVTSDTAYNVYLAVTPKSDFTEEATTLKWLTSNADNGKSFSGTKITKVNDNRFLVTWEEYNEDVEMSGTDTLSTSVLHYVFIDGSGEKISEEYTAAASISDCHPILSGSKIVYYASNASAVDFYTIDASTGEFSKRCYQVVGENATWSFEDGVLTISGSGELALARNSIGYELVWSEFDDEINKIVIKEGITSIGDSYFSGIDALTEVVIEDGVKSIGDYAFSHSYNSVKITIPDSVTEIGENVTWGGWYSYSDEKVGFGTIYANSGSYAVKYALKNGIDYVLLDKEVTYTCSLLDDGTVEITGYSGSPTEVTIPSTIEGYKVTSIGNWAFQGCDSLVSVTIESGITNIGDYAFDGCGGLTDVTIPGSVVSVGNSAFEYCDNLKTVTLENGVKSIGDYAFSGSSIEKVTIPDSVTEIGENITWSGYYSTLSGEKVGFGTIYANSGSYAIQYAKDNNVDYVLLDATDSDSSVFPNLLTLGDVNKDGDVDISDATAIQKAVAQIITLTDAQQKAADVNGDNTIDISDATMIQKFVAQIIASFTTVK